MRIESLLSLTLAVVMVAALAPRTLAAQEGGEHSHHHHHQMTDAQFARLRDVIDQYKSMSNEEILQSMADMPGNYHWYISAADMRGNLGVLVLAHGAGKRGDQVFKDSLEPLAARFPVVMGFGMSMMGSGHLQAAVTALDDAGADTIVVVPAALSRNASVYRQWDYIFGGRQDPAYLETDPIHRGKQFFGRFISPQTPRGWKKIVENFSSQSAPQATTATAQKSGEPTRRTTVSKRR